MTREAERLKEMIERSRKQEDNKLPAFISDAFAVEKNNVHGFQVYRLIPERAKGNIFYLYHSDYTRPIRKKEWSFIQWICSMTGMAVTVPIYPLAPEHDCEEVFDMLVPAYQIHCKHREAGELLLMGAGAGAGLAISLMLQIWKEGLADPDKVILISPVMDTEFFDEKLESGLAEKMGKQFLPMKELLNETWVRNYAGRTEFTAPVYEDLHDISQDIIVFSGTGDCHNAYARYFSQKVQDTGNPLKYFEYGGAERDFFLDPNRKETKHMKKLLHDFLLNTDDAIIHQYMEEVRQKAGWSKHFPDIFLDEHAVKYVAAHPKRGNREVYNQNIFNLMSASVQRAYDEAVRLFLKEYPEGNVIYVGCSLDTMLERVDNGRVLWYNLDSPGRMAIRTMYTGLGTREKRIERSVHDPSWMDRLSMQTDRGVLFVIKDIFAYMNRKEMREFLDLLYQHFQGCNVIFDMATPRANFMYNRMGRGRGAEYRKRHLSMRDPRREVEAMSPLYDVVSVRSVVDDIRPRKEWKTSLKLLLMSNRRRESWKIVHIRLGHERYRTFDSLSS